MARNKYETLESIDKQMAELESKKKELEQAKINLAEKDNSRLGKLVRSVFRKSMPLQKSEQTLFFKAVADTYAKAVANGTAVEWKTDDKPAKVEKANDAKSDVTSDDSVQATETNISDNEQDVEAAE